MNTLNGKIALITGGASGLGAATARRFSELGSRVVIADIDVTAGRALAEEIGAEFQHFDQSMIEDCQALAETIDRTHGRLDILFNNAGIGWAGRFEDCAPDELDRMIAVDLLGPWWLTRHCLALLRAGAKANPASGAALLFTSSALALRPRPGCAPYVVVKSGIIGLAKALAAELGPDGIRVNALCPGLVDTPASRAFTSAWGDNGSAAIFDRYRAESPLGRIAEAEDVAALAAFLASDEGRAISASAIAIDCGTSGR